MIKREVTSLLLTALGIAFFAAGCGESQSGDSQDKNSSRSTAEINRIRSLGYVDGAPIQDGDRDGLTIHDPERSCPGYSLYSLRRLNRADLLDEDAEIVRTWQYPSGSVWSNCELLPNGDLLLIGADRRGDGNPDEVNPIHDNKRYVMRMNWDGEILWKQQYNAHHDIEVTPDGNILVLTFMRRLIPRVHPSIKTRDDQLTLLNPDGAYVKSLSIVDAIRPNPDAFELKPVEPGTLGGDPWMDLFHSNSLEWMHHANLFDKSPLFAPDNILVCFRHQDRIAIFDWKQRQVVWSWGEHELMGPHDAQVLENGHITVFDNGLGRGYSRAIELDPATSKIVWEYKADPPSDFYTASKGSMQRLPNGNTLLAESDEGRAFEVTPEGEIVWEFITPHRVSETERAAIVRMKRYPRAYVEAIIKAHGD